MNGIYKIKLRSCLHHWVSKNNYFQQLPKPKDLVLWACAKILERKKHVKIKGIHWDWNQKTSYIKMTFTFLWKTNESIEDYIIQWVPYDFEGDSSAKKYLTHENHNLRQVAKKLLEE